MNIFQRFMDVSIHRWGECHMDKIKNIADAVGDFIESEFFDDDDAVNAGLDELIEFLQHLKKQKPQQQQGK
jgi:hypothetical protein